MFIVSLANRGSVWFWRRCTELDGQFQLQKEVQRNERKFNMESRLSRKKGAFAGQRKLYKASPNE